MFIDNKKLENDTKLKRNVVNISALATLSI